MFRLSATALLVLAFAAPQALADDRHHGQVKRIQLSGAQEDPTVITDGRGSATLRIQGASLVYDVRYLDLESDIEQAHIHIGDDDTTGGIAAFLCSDLGNGPAGTASCPPAPGRLTGAIVASEVIGPAAQGVPPGNIAKLIRAVRAGLVYINIHTVGSPAGEIRGDVKRDR